MVATADIDVSDPVTYGTDSVYALRFTIEHSIPQSGIIALYIPKQFGIDSNKILKRSNLCTKHDYLYCTGIP